MIASNINYNYTFLSYMNELVGSIVGDKFITIEVKTAESEFQAVKKRIAKKPRQMQSDSISYQGKQGS